MKGSRNTTAHQLISICIWLGSCILPSLASAQGTLPIALQQQFSFTNCQTFTNACGTPLQGGLLYFYQVGTVATVQNSFQDIGLTITNPWPLVLDANGRIPNFYLANGSVHVRLTDANGIVQFDLPNALVIGPSSGGGGGGSVDPTTVSSTGDIKFRMTQEFVTGWVKLNAQTIGNAVSGATQRANADTQNLYVYFWTNCSNPTSNSATHCPVQGGLGANALADFNAGKQLQLPDWRGRGPMGVDDMGNSAAGRIFAQNVTSGGADTTTTPGASGGEALHTMLPVELAAHNHTASSGDSGHGHTAISNDSGHSHTTGTESPNVFGAGNNPAVHTADNGIAGTLTTNTGFANITTTVNTGFANISTTIGTTGSSQPFNNLSPFLLGSWYVKL